jgi:hypothetical protein
MVIEKILFLMISQVWKNFVTSFLAFLGQYTLITFLNEQLTLQQGIDQISKLRRENKWIIKYIEKHKEIVSSL